MNEYSLAKVQYIIMCVQVLQATDDQLRGLYQAKQRNSGHGPGLWRCSTTVWTTAPCRILSRGEILPLPPCCQWTKDKSLC